VGAEEVAVDVSVIVDYGMPIQIVGRDVQENIRKSIETMTGLHVLKVDVHVLGVSFEKENKELEQGQEVARLQSAGDGPHLGGVLPEGADDEGKPVPKQKKPKEEKPKKTAKKEPKVSDEPKEEKTNEDPAEQPATETPAIPVDPANFPNEGIAENVPADVATPVEPVTVIELPEPIEPAEATEAIEAQADGKQKNGKKGKKGRPAKDGDPSEPPTI